jgi:hypothetical protein
MSDNKKMTWIWFFVFGMVLFPLGFFLACGGTFVSLLAGNFAVFGVGACLGIPTFIAGIVLLIIGVARLSKWSFHRSQQLIAAGVREGIQSAAASNPPTPTETLQPPSDSSSRSRIG